MQASAEAAQAINSDQPLVIDGEHQTEGLLTIDTTADQAITVTPTGRWQHQGEINIRGQKIGLLIEAGGQATIHGKLHSHGNSGQGVYLASSSQLNVNGVLSAVGGQQDLQLAADSQLKLTGRGSLRLTELSCAPGSHCCVQGDYPVEIDRLSYQGDDLTAKPAQLAFALQPANALRIKQFSLPKLKSEQMAEGVVPQAPIQLTINGQLANIHFDVKNQSLASTHQPYYYYQNTADAVPIPVTISGNSEWQLPNSAQLIQQTSSVALEDGAPGAQSPSPIRHSPIVKNFSSTINQVA